MIASYSPKKGKVVTFLSTMHLDKGTKSPGPEKKPEVITYYNATKGGVETMDQMVRWFTTERKTRRWPMVIFYNMLDISALNAFIVWMSLNKENYTAKRGHRLRRSLLISGKGTGWTAGRRCYLNTSFIISKYKKAKALLHVSYKSRSQNKNPL